MKTYHAKMEDQPWTWGIYAPSGEILAVVGSAEEADLLLYHLNGNGKVKAPKPR